MSKNLYYRALFQRRNPIKESILSFADMLASYPKLTLEVFIRKNFGERYLNTGSVIIAMLILLILPFFGHALSYAPTAFFRATGVINGGYQDYSPQAVRGSFWSKYLTWYLFSIAFLYFAIQRLKEIKKSRSTFDFNVFSLYSGDINPWFYDFPILKKRPDVRQVEILCEPALFFSAGLVLWLLGQSVGWLLVIGSILYSLSKASLYKRGDDFVLDLNDERILNEELEDNFVDDIEPENSRGVRFYLRKPTDKELRRKLAQEMVTEDDNADMTLAA